MLSEIPLIGCTPEPLSSYLKALGVLRLLSERGSISSSCAKDGALAKDAQAYWDGDVFVLVSQLTRDDLEKFFLYEYAPTPLVSPWNGSTGFYPKDKQQSLLQEILNSSSDRFVDYQEAIQIAQKQVERLNLTMQPKDKQQKKLLLTYLRNRLPDRAVKWLDACVVLTSEDTNFPPLLGTGGNDGNFEFSRTFMQQLQVLIDFKSGSPTPEALPLLKAALFNETLPMMSFSGKIGQFNPIAAGGANAAPGYDAESRVNPWEFVLMLEGILLFTAGVTRRYGQNSREEGAYPFTVKPSNAGYGSASENDQVRAELWAPLWSRPAGLAELKVLFGEGRAKVNHSAKRGQVRYRTAQNGVDFARAISTLGVTRGLSEFVRYSFQERNGLSYFAIPLGRYPLPKYPRRDPLRELDDWLSGFSRVAQGSDAPASVRRAHQQLETAIIDLSRGKVTLLGVLIALGDIDKALDRSLQFTLEKRISPIPVLRSSRWLRECYDDSPEFRLALSLAVGGVPALPEKTQASGADTAYQLGGLRPRLVKVRGIQRAFWQQEEDNITIWQEGALEKNLISLRRRVEIETERQEKQAETAIESLDLDELEEESNSSVAPISHPPLPWLASLRDITEWIRTSEPMRDRRIEAIARGLALVCPSRRTVTTQHSTYADSVDYALVKLVQHRVLKAATVNAVFQYQVLNDDLTMPRVPNLIPRLAAGDIGTAIATAIRRLRASGVQPAVPQTSDGGDSAISPQRLAAALAFPISDRDVDHLLQRISRLDPLSEDE